MCWACSITRLASDYTLYLYYIRVQPLWSHLDKQLHCHTTVGTCILTLGKGHRNKGRIVQAVYAGTLDTTNIMRKPLHSCMYLV